jgi:Na+-transporting methylmalonyl-CoA/oxaloacetate decarboxylase gamma subunit
MQGVFQQTGPEMSENIDLSELGFPVKSSSNSQGRNALPGRAQAVPIYSLPLVEDHSLKGYHLCAKQAEWRLQNLEDSQTLEIFNNDMAELVKHLSENNVQVGNYSVLGRVAEITLSNKFENIKLPAGIAPESQFFKDLKFVYEFYYTKTVEALPIQRALYAKPLLVSILEYIDDFLADRTPRNAIFLSAHDTTLNTLLAAFNITNTDCLIENYRNEKAGKPINYPDCVYPQYASNMVFEVYKTPEPSLALYYDGKPINICGKKSNRCSVKDFINYATQVTDSVDMENYLGQCDPLHSENRTTIIEKVKQSKSKIILQTFKGFTNLEVKLMMVSVVLSLLIVAHWCISQRIEVANEKIRAEDLESIPSTPDNEIVVNVAQAAQEES